MPKITILCGIPCAGKTTYCKKFPKSDIISRDAIRLVFFEKDYQYTDFNEQRVTEIFRELFDDSVKEKKDIILDNTYCKEKYLNEAIKMVPNGWKWEVKFFDIPLWRAHIRNIIRNITQKKWIPYNIMEQMKRNYDKIDRKKYERILM